MKAIYSEAKAIITENYRNAETSISLREYVELESQSDPNFFRFFFNEEFDNDFDYDLTEEHKASFQAFLLSLD